MKLNRTVGIDLGTTNSSVALLMPDGSDLVLYEDRFRRKTIPSMVGWNPATQALVTGYEAWHRRVMTPPPVASIKRKMGSPTPVEVGPQAMRPEAVSAHILERLMHEMQGFVRERVEDVEVEIDSAVITVPAYFDAPQIDATRRAGELAGIRVVGLLQEPTAAALYYSWKHGIGDGTFLVYDLGGGTFDVSVIRCLLGEYQVLGVHGDNYLGGDDFDRRLAEHFREHLCEQGYSLELDVAEDPQDRVRFELLTRLAQEVKEALSTSEFQYVARRDIFEDKDGQPVTLELEISREQFEGLIEDLIDSTVRCCHEALARSQARGDVGLADVDFVLLVGGSTRVPLVQRKIAEALCGPERSKAERPLLDEPDTCVTLGAAIHAGNLAGSTLYPDDAPIAGESADAEGAPDTSSESARVHLYSPLGTSEATLHMGGELLGAAAPGAIKTAVLVENTGDVAAIVRVDHEDDGVVSFAFEELALPDEGRYDYRLEFCDAGGDALVGFPLWVRRHHRDLAHRTATGALSNPSVLAKDIYLDIVRDGRPARQLLLPHGTSLPAEGQFRFFTADRSGAVLLRLYQNRFPIRTIHLELPADTPVGTPIEFTLTVDEAMTMVATGEVLGQTFWAQIEAPPAREIRGWEQIEALLEEVEAVGNRLWGHEARRFREATDPLVHGVRETARTDPDKLQVLAARLEDALEDYLQPGAELTPAYSRVETLLDAIRRLVFSEERPKHLGVSLEDWQARIEELEREARTTYEARDQAAWARAFTRVQATWESIAQDEYRFRTTDPHERARMLLVTLASIVDELRYNLESFTLSTSPETRQLQLRELGDLKHALEQNVVTPLARLDPERLDPARATPELERLYETATHIRHSLEKLPTLGLVRG